MLNDLFGKVFGRLTALVPVERAGKDLVYCCECECGRFVFIRRGNLNSGCSKSCGCLKNDRQTTHGLAGSRQYVIWSNMRRRCNDESNPEYENYGGRGITVCPAWDASFIAFWNDMASGYADHLTIERKDVHGNYTPENCTWATRSEQNQTKRKSGSSSVYRGVTAARGKWMAQIMKDKKRKYLGLFDCELDAAMSYDAAALEFFGASAALNFPIAKLGGAA